MQANFADEVYQVRRQPERQVTLAYLIALRLLDLEVILFYFVEGALGLLPTQERLL